MQGREAPLRLFGPPPARSFLDRAIHLGYDRYAFPIEITELTGGEAAYLSGVHGWCSHRCRPWSSGAGLQAGGRSATRGIPSRDRTQAGDLGGSSLWTIAARRNGDHSRRRSHFTRGSDGPAAAGPFGGPQRGHPPNAVRGGRGRRRRSPHPRGDLCRCRDGAGARDAPLDGSGVSQNGSHGWGKPPGADPFQFKLRVRPGEADGRGPRRAFQGPSWPTMASPSSWPSSR